MPEFEKCKQDIIYFADNYYKIINLDRGLETIKLFDVQKQMLRMMAEGNLIAHSKRQITGKTTLCCIFALWTALFFENSKIVIVCHSKQSIANFIFDKLMQVVCHIPISVEFGLSQTKTNKLASENTLSPERKDTTHQG